MRVSREVRKAMLKEGKKSRESPSRAMYHMYEYCIYKFIEGQQFRKAFIYAIVPEHLVGD